MTTATLNRQTFASSRLLEFFSEKELAMQIGHEQLMWPIVLVKELIDNSLDACEEVGVPPAIRIIVEPNAVTVEDNGGGLPSVVIERSLDYTVRVSNKNHYVSPHPWTTRQCLKMRLGRALRDRR